MQKLAIKKFIESIIEEGVSVTWKESESDEFVIARFGYWEEVGDDLFNKIRTIYPNVEELEFEDDETKWLYSYKIPLEN